MIKRWLIRSLFVLPLVCMVAAWAGSYFQMLGVARNGSHHRQRLEMECGTISYYVDTNSGLLPPEGAYWTWVHWPSDSVRMDYLYRIADIRFLGFAYRPTPALFQSWVCFIPLWFPTALSALLLWLVWRKTGPKPPGRAFPVEPAAQPGDSNP